MKSPINILAVIVTLALPCFAYAGSADVQVDPNQAVDISLSGTADGNVEIRNISTNQVVATAHLLRWGPGYTNWYSLTSVNTVSGVTWTKPSITDPSTITGLPPGEYRITTQTSGYTGGWSWSQGNYAEILDCDPNFGNAVNDYVIYVY